MPSYQNIYLQQDKQALEQVVRMGPQCYCAGEIDATVTWVTDEVYAGSEIKAADFENSIQIGDLCYLESLDRLAFHSGPVKLTTVKVNDRPPGKILIGNGVGLLGTAILAYEKVQIDDKVTVGPGTTIMDSSGHPIVGRGRDDEASRITSKPVHIMEGAWIGINAIILKGVTIGKNAIVGAGSVVTQSVPDNAIAMGNPAVVIKYIEPEKTEQYAREYTGV